MHIPARSVARDRGDLLRRDLAARGPLRVVSSTEIGDVHEAQRLRYEVFYGELNARPDALIEAAGRDFDEFDSLCDHILVLDESSSGRIVGAYRALSEGRAGFYSEREFDLAPLLQRHHDLHFLELGRACVLAPYRTRPVLELLWQGIWNYVRAQAIDVMFGCVSFAGADPVAHERQLSFLAHNFMAPEAWRVTALPDRKASLRPLSKHSYDARQIVKTLPPLLKGYLRLGCYIGDGVVIDEQFNSTDIFVILPVANINSRYFSRFGAPGQGISC